MTTLLDWNDLDDFADFVMCRIPVNTRLDIAIRFTVEQEAMMEPKSSYGESAAETAKRLVAMFNERHKPAPKLKLTTKKVNYSEQYCMGMLLSAPWMDGDRWVSGIYMGLTNALKAVDKARLAAKEEGRQMAREMIAEHKRKQYRNREPVNLVKGGKSYECLVRNLFQPN